MRKGLATIRGLTTVPWLTWLTWLGRNRLRADREDSVFRNLRYAKRQIPRLGKESPDRRQCNRELGSNRTLREGDWQYIVDLRNEDRRWYESGTE
jgi:hypothetical protein